MIRNLMWKCALLFVLLQYIQWKDFEMFKYFWLYFSDNHKVSYVYDQEKQRNENSNRIKFSRVENFSLEDRPVVS